MQFLLIVLLPLAFAPFVERRASPRMPVPLIWLGMVIAVLASAVVTSYGHLSLQFVLIVLIMWSAVFLTRQSARVLLLASLAVVTTASVWVPLNVLGVAIIVLTGVWVFRRRDWPAAGLWAVTLVAAGDSLLSSVGYLLGVDVGVGATAGIEGAESAAPAPGLAAASTALFTAPGGVERIQPLLGGLALICVLAAAWWLDRGPGVLAGRRRTVVNFAPIILLGGYLLLIQMADAVSTASAPHYGGDKFAFALGVTALASTLPFAGLALDASHPGMTPLRWLALGGVLVLLTFDTLLPRAVSAVSPKLWPSVSPDAPAYWAGAEVKPQAEQTLSSLPIACLFAPPTSAVPTALPLGQESYSCTRLMLGLSGLEGKFNPLIRWLQTDWASNRANWPEFVGALDQAAGDLRGRSVLLMKADGTTSGITTIGDLLDRYRETRPSS